MVTAALCFASGFVGAFVSAFFGPMWEQRRSRREPLFPLFDEWRKEHP